MTGQLTLRSGGERFAIGFQRGMIAGADRKAVVDRVARTFALSHGEFVLEDRITIPLEAERPIDTRAMIYFGARNKMSEQRLGEELRKLGDRFTLRLDADLNAYDLLSDEQPVLAMLRRGCGLADLAANGRELAAVYALACTGACDVGPARTRTPTTTAVPRTLTPRSDRLANGSGKLPALDDNRAVLAWAQFCQAPDKHQVAEVIRRELATAIARSAYPAVATYYLARVEQFLGREREAMRLFHRVLLLDPDHVEARAELQKLRFRR